MFSWGGHTFTKIAVVKRDPFIVTYCKKKYVTNIQVSLMDVVPFEVS